MARDETKGQGIFAVAQFAGLHTESAPHLVKDGQFSDLSNVRTRDGSLSKRKGAKLVRFIESPFMALVTPILLFPVSLPHGDYGCSISSTTPMVRDGETPADFAPVPVIPDPDEPWEPYSNGLVVIDVSIPAAVVAGVAFTVTARAYSVAAGVRTAYALASGTGLVLFAQLYSPGGAAAPAVSLGVNIATGWVAGVWTGSATIAASSGYTRLLVWVDASAAAGGQGKVDRAVVS